MGSQHKRNQFGTAFSALALGLSLSLTPVLAQQTASNTTVSSVKPAATLPAGMKKMFSVEGITEYQLENGLKVLLFPDPSKQTITVNMTYLVGSRHENYGETGMAHLLEHLLFKGSKRHTNIPQELTEHGARPNGTTWLDRTNYFETFQATDDNLNWALDLEADRMVNSFVAKKDLDSEMTVVRNEFEIGENSPQSVLLSRVVSTAFLWHNYGNDTIGARSDIERVPIERLQAFYRNYYQPDNAVLMVAGKIDEAKTLNLIQKYFAEIPKPQRQLQNTYTVDPVQDGERIVTLRRVGDVQAVCTVYHTPAGSHPDSAAVDILTAILGDSDTGRLKKTLVDTKKATSAGGFTFQLREPGVAIFQADVRQELSLDEARDTLIRTVEGIVNNPPTTEEVERARASLLQGFQFTLNSSERLGLELSEWMAKGDWRLFFLHRDRLEKVTPADVQRVAKAYLKQSNRTVGMFIPTPQPERADIPDTPDVAEMLKDYRSKEEVAVGEAFDPAPNNIESRTDRNVIGGLRVALLPKKTRGGTVRVSMRLRFGDEKSLFNKSAIGGFTGDMLMRGTKKYTREQLTDEINRLKIVLRASGGPTSAFVTIEAKRETLKQSLDLLAEILRQPAFPQSEFEQLKEEQLANIERQRSEPTSIAFTTFGRHFNNRPKGHVLYQATPEESLAEIKAVTIDQVKDFYNNFYGASVGEVAVVGDFDKATVGNQINQLFGNWQAKSAYKYINTLYQDVAPINKTFETPDKANAVFVAGQNLDIRDDDLDYPALLMGNFMLGGGFLNARLPVRIRQKEGLSYTVATQLNAGSIDRGGSFFMFAFYAPENAEKLEAAFKDEINKMLRDGFTEQELSVAKTGFLQGRQVSRAQDAELAGRLSSYLFLNRTLAFDATLEERIKNLTLAEINAAMRKYINLDKITIVKAGDFAKAASKANNK
jgi:zinc protease